MRLLGTIFAGLLATPEAPETTQPPSMVCDEEAFERLEAHIAFLGREVATLRTELAAVESVIQRHDETIGGLTTLGRAARIDANGDLVLTGINLRLVNGAEAPGEMNGKGNLLLGSGTTAQAVDGSHNLVIGPAHNVAGRDGIVVGSSHVTHGSYSVVIGGIGSEAGQTTTVVGSLFSGALGHSSVIMGGRDLWAYGPRSVLIAGQRQDSDRPDEVLIAGEAYRTE